MPGVVVVTYNSEGVIGECLQACLRIPGAEIVVVDNASTDGTVQCVIVGERIRLIANSENRGFAGGVNQGFAALHQPAVLILNPDAAPVSGIQALEQAVLQQGVGAATGQLLGAEGYAQHGFNVRALPTAASLIFEVLGLNRILPANPINRRYRKKSPTSAADVEQPAAAFLMVRRTAWAELGGFDENFFPIWFEDVDFCKRMLDHGYRIWYVPEASAKHHGGHSATRLGWRDRQRFWYGSLLRYTSKHFSGASRIAIYLAVMLCCFPRALAGMWQVGFTEAVSVFGSIFSLTLDGLRVGERGREVPANKTPSKEQFKQSR